MVFVPMSDKKKLSFSNTHSCHIVKTDGSHKFISHF